MQFYEAKVADIVRCSQRDELFVEDLQKDLFSILKLLGAKNYTNLRKIVPVIGNSWYYYLTSFSNLQTLGEEYTGTLRLTDDKKVPSKLLQVMWLVLYIGGESIYGRFFEHIKYKISASGILVESAKKDLLKLVAFMTNNKLDFLRLHHSLFYINPIYYNVSNRIAGIKYVLLRQWLQDDSSTKSFNILGKISLAYLIYDLIQKAISSRMLNNTETIPYEATTSMTKLCSLCAESRKNTCATSCGHLFCWECIYDSLKYQQNCPICRELINPSRIIYLQNYS